MNLDATVDARVLTLSAVTTLVKARHTIVPGGAASFAVDDALAGVARSTGRVRVDGVIGEGGMGRVNLGTQLTLGRAVAIKTLKSEVAGPDATRGLLREAWITGALEHPNVIPIYDLDVDAAGLPYFVMKRVEGASWLELLGQPGEVAARFGEADPLLWNLGVLSDVARAVHFAHTRGILHRDLKPENVMIGGFGEVYLVDWGIAVAVADDVDPRLPRARDAVELAGTPSYMAPEMLSGGPALGPHTDVYLLGATLYEVLVGEPPHRGDHMRALVASIVLSEPDVPAHVPDELAAIIRRAMARDPAARHESADAFRRDVESFLRHRGSTRLSTAAWDTVERLAVVARGATSTDRARLYDLLGECRFGFRAAREAWAENPAVTDGLDRALAEMVEFELLQSNPRAAASLLDEMKAPPAALSARVRALLADRAREEAEAERLQEIGREMDPTRGWRTRSFVAGTLGMTWTLLCYFAPRLEHDPTHLSSFVMTLAMAGVVVVVGVWARQTLSQTLVNRRGYATLLVTILVQLVFLAGAGPLGLSVHTARTMYLLLWGIALAYSTVHVDNRLWPAMLVPFASFFAAIRFPGALYSLMALGNLVFTVNVLAVWIPWRQLVASRR
ncbi:MAG: serine/threonine protein kinase [Polyangiaceae bacterium]|nr:serine/threonine protein kinase [Polyangiaceae bacterium]